MKGSITFDVEGAIKSLREGKDLSGQDGILTPEKGGVPFFFFLFQNY